MKFIVHVEIRINHVSAGTQVSCEYVILQYYLVHVINNEYEQDVYGVAEHSTNLPAFQI